MRNVSNLKEDVSAILTGVDLDNVPNPYGSFQRAVATFIQKADVLEASGRESIMLYDRVTTYAGPERMFGGALVDIRPQGVDRAWWDGVEKIPIMRFDRTKHYTPSGYRVTFEDRMGELLMRISQNFAKEAITVDGMNETTGWVLSGNGSGLAQDTTVFYHQPGSLRFNLDAAGSQALLTKTLTNPLNLSLYEGVGVAFLAIYMPGQTQPLEPITSISLKLGSSSTAYYEMTETEGFLGAFYADDFLLVALNLAGVSPTGSPDFSEVDYVQVAINYNGTLVPNVRVGDLFVALPSAHEVLYYSPAVFLEDGAMSSEITDDDTLIVFRDAAYNIYVQECAREIAKNQGGTIGSGVIAAIDLVLEGQGDKKLGLYQQYRGDNPSEEIRQVGNYYYDDPNGGGYTAGR